MPTSGNTASPLGRALGLLAALTWRDLRRRTLGSVLGVGWLFLQPILYLGVIGFVFSAALGSRPGMAATSSVPYSRFLVAGLIPWLLAQEAWTRSAPVVIEHEALVKRVHFPLWLLPMHRVLGTAVTGLFWVIPAWIYLGLAGGWGAVWWQLLPLSALFALFVLGGALFLSATAVFVRDVLHGLGTLLMVLMYATPIFYPVEIFPSAWRWLPQANPMAWFIGGYRQVLLGGAPLSAGYWGILSVWATALGGMGVGVFAAGRRHFADVL